MTLKQRDIDKLAQVTFQLYQTCRQINGNKAPKNIKEMIKEHIDEDFHDEGSEGCMNE